MWWGVGQKSVRKGGLSGKVIDYVILALPPLSFDCDNEEEEREFAFIRLVMRAIYLFILHFYCQHPRKRGKGGRAEKGILTLQHFALACTTSWLQATTTSFCL
jgi:hypothetical protein